MKQYIISIKKGSQVAPLNYRIYLAGKITSLSPAASNSLNAPLAISFLGLEKSNTSIGSANATFTNGLSANASPLAE